MGKKALSKRSIWQDYSGHNALNAEKNFYEVFLNYFKNTDFRVRANPSEFRKIYINVELDKKESLEIYTPDIDITTHGITPDYAIDNIKTGKTLYIEVKRQDGWVEGKARSAGRGNAHERSCKYFTPGLLKILREQGNIDKDHLPFWVVFQGDITRDPCRVREIKCWYEDYSDHYFMWRDTSNGNSLIDYFNKKLKYILL